MPLDDPDAVAADDQLLEDLRAGAQPPTRDQVAVVLAAWRDSVSYDPEPIYTHVVEQYLAATTTHDIDTQSLAYRGMTDAERVPDDQLGRHTSRQHPPLDTAPPRDQLLLPEDWERAGWDTGRADPRSEP